MDKLLLKISYMKQRCYTISFNLNQVKNFIVLYINIYIYITHTEINDIIHYVVKIQKVTNENI